MSTPLPLTIDQIHKAARQLAQLRPSYAAMLDFYEAVFTAQEKTKADIDLEPIHLSLETLASRGPEGMALVTVADFRIDAAASERLLKTLCELIITHATQIKTSAAAVSDALSSGTLRTQDLFAGLLQSKDRLLQDTAAAIGAESKALAFLAYHSAQPSLELCAVQLATYLDSEAVWRKGHCPVCGSHPGLAVLGAEGRRSLYCPFCRHQWRAPRIFCANCENTRTGELHYFFSEGEKDLRVDVCDRCRHYIKSIDQRAVARPVYLPLEQIASLHLDIIAADKGYSGGVDLNLAD
jgi:FdhE protein